MKDYWGAAQTVVTAKVREFWPLFSAKKLLTTPSHTNSPFELNLDHDPIENACPWLGISPTQLSNPVLTGIKLNYTLNSTNNLKQGGPPCMAFIRWGNMAELQFDQPPRTLWLGISCGYDVDGSDNPYQQSACQLAEIL